jgi:cytochrome bd-type quinol oxidase subunit 1
MVAVEAMLLLLAAVAVYAPLTRRLDSNRMVLFILCGSAVGGGYLAWRLWSGAEVYPDLLAVALLYACLCELFLILFAFSLTSISASLTARLSRTPMTAAEVDEAYASRDMVEVRIRRLEEGGYVEVADGAVTLTARGQRTVRTFLRIQRLLGLD